MRRRVVSVVVMALVLAPSAVAATDPPHYDVPPGFTRCPQAKAEGGFFKWASVERATCHSAAEFMTAYAARSADGPMPRHVRGYACDIHYWRNADGDIFASRHACRHGRVAIRFYGMV